MLSAENTIQYPAYEFFSEQAVVDQLTVNARKMEQKGQHAPIRYHNRNQIEEEQEELAIAGGFEETKNIKDLSQLLREGKLKEFY